MNLDFKWYNPFTHGKQITLHLKLQMCWCYAHYKQQTGETRLHVLITCSK